MKVNLKIGKPKTINYTIKAKSYNDAHDELDKRTEWGEYKSNLKYAFQDMKDGTVTQITFTAKPTIEMPKWANASKLKGQEKKNWDAMIKALKRHEMGHHEIVLTDTKAFKKKREKLGNFPKSDFNKVITEFATAAKDNQVNYDRKNDHGAKEGVGLPPVT